MMRGRFGRRRWGGGGGNDDGGNRPLDPGQEISRVLRLGLVPADALEPTGTDEVLPSMAVVATGTSREGEELIVAIAPQGGDAWLAALAIATRQGDFRGSALAIAPSWSLAARRRLGLLRSTPFRIVARREPVPGAAEAGVETEPLERALAVPAPLSPALADRAVRALFERTELALAGLAAKHGGALRRAAGGIELLLLGRVVAVLRVEGANVAIELREGRRETARLEPDGVAEVFDRLEGSLRKFLGDRRSRETDVAARFVLAQALLGHLALRAARSWPLPGEPGDAIDFAGADERGAGLVGVARASLGLTDLGPVIDGWAELVPALPALVPGVDGARAALCVAAEHLAPAAQRVLALLDADVRWLEASRRGREPSFVVRTLPVPADAKREPWIRPSPSPPPARVETAPPAIVEATPAPVTPPRAMSESQAESNSAPTAEASARRPYEEFSLFDLGESGPDEAASADGRRRRRRRRGRGRSRTGGPPNAARDDAGEAGEADESDEEEEPAAQQAERSVAPPERTERDRRPQRGRGRRAPEPRSEAVVLAEPDAGEAADEDEVVELDDAIAELAEIPEMIEAPEPTYEEDEEEGGEPETDEQRRMRQEREQRRRARLAKGDPEPDVKAPPRPPRRRAAILAHADRESVAAAVLLARDIRLIEGIWIYPQEDLMTFFRSIATDLREDTPIVVVGFSARPVRETLQTASLYRDRLVWYDHHEWPPEDLGAMRDAIGADSVHVDAAAGSPLAVVLSVCTRRSRFSDKLVDLLTGRFSTHDYARWGRLWWSRLAQLAARHGERRTELDALLQGRPSDLARQAARVAAPPVPEEVAWVATRDFRIVHFGGYTMVRVPVDAEHDLHLAARIARERYRAALSLAWNEGGDRFVLTGDEVAARRPLDVGAMIEHLAEKFEWVTALPDPDHIARLRIADAAAQPGRIDEVVAEIAMGRSMLEG